jgi:hypothetical protein
VQHNAPSGSSHALGARVEGTLHGHSDYQSFSHSPAPARGRVSGLTPKGQLTAALIRLEHLVDRLTESERQDLAAELIPIGRCARSTSAR